MFAIREQNDTRDFFGFFESASDTATELSRLDAMSEKMSRLCSNFMRPKYVVVDLGNEYNGWLNRETWVMHLWLTNDYNLYVNLRAILLEHINRKRNVAQTAEKLEQVILLSSRATIEGICQDLHYGDLPEKFTPSLMLKRYFQSSQNKIVWREVIPALMESILGEYKSEWQLR